jgi:polysaccharide biosynthesis transport protein
LKVLSSDRFAQIVAASRRNYDFVIMDSPPVLHVADAVVLAKLCQHIIFIVQAGRLPNGLVNEATRRFDQQDRAKMLTLLTRVRPSHSDRRDYYSGYAAS